MANAASPCCVCIGGVNYTVSCRCSPCGGNTLAMSTTNPNPAVSQNVCTKAGDGGAGALSCFLNAAGKWGSVITAQVQGKPVSTSCGLRVGGSAAYASAVNAGNMTWIILIVVVILAFMFLKKG